MIERALAVQTDRSRDPARGRTPKVHHGGTTWPAFGAGSHSAPAGKKPHADLAFSSPVTSPAVDVRAAVVAQGYRTVCSVASAGPETGHLLHRVPEIWAKARVRRFGCPMPHQRARVLGAACHAARLRGALGKQPRNIPEEGAP